MTPLAEIDGEPEVAGRPGQALVRAMMLRGYDRLVTSLGGEPAELLRMAKLDAAALDLPYALVPHRRLTAALDLAAACLACPEFGARLAAVQMSLPPTSSALGMLLTYAPTLRDAFDIADRYIRSYIPTARIVIQSLGDDEALVLTIDPARRAALRQVVLHALMYYHLMSARAVGGPGARAVWLTGAADGLAGLFDVAVLGAQRFDGLLFPPAILDVPLRGYDPVRYEIAKGYLSDNGRDGAAPVAGYVQWLLTRCPPDGADLANIAAQLHLHPRILQRRLRAERTSFETLRDDRLRGLALRHLQQDALSIAEVASELGYTRRGAFTRSCHRWFGRGPRAIRKQAAI